MPFVLSIARLLFVAVGLPNYVWTSNLSIQKAREHDFAGAYVLIQRAITNYESIKLPAKTMWLPTMQVAQLYRQASAFAAMTGKIDEAQNYAKKAQEVILK